MTQIDHPDTEQGHATETQEVSLSRYHYVRGNSLKLAAPLSHEDWMLQSMEEASPIKWHLAHTSWFFETFILTEYQPGYQIFHPDFCFLFNSYYQQVGTMHKRARRGLLSRPSADMVCEYRAHVDQAMETLITNSTSSQFSKFQHLITLGCAHEEQHQELMQTDVMHGLSRNTMLPAAYTEPDEIRQSDTPTETDNPYSIPMGWISFPAGMVDIGAETSGFAFDNEQPRHRFFQNDFELSSRPVSNREYLAFIEDGGYADSRFWLSDGWALAQTEGWQTPLYWRKGEDDVWYQYTLFGEYPLMLDAPVCHVSFYEAAAYASWLDVWLPTEREWEVAAATTPICGQFLCDGTPQAKSTSVISSNGLVDLYGSVWEWTQSPYSAYPGYKPARGAIGEYNGKFMSSQMVLRGGVPSNAGRTYSPHLPKLFSAQCPLAVFWVSACAITGRPQHSFPHCPILQITCVWGHPKPDTICDNFYVGRYISNRVCW